MESLSTAIDEASKCADFVAKEYLILNDLKDDRGGKSPDFSYDLWGGRKTTKTTSLNTWESLCESYRRSPVPETRTRQALTTFFEWVSSHRGSTLDEARDQIALVRTNLEQYRAILGLIMKGIDVNDTFVSDPQPSDPSTGNISAMEYLSRRSSLRRDRSIDAIMKEFRNNVLLGKILLMDSSASRQLVVGHFLYQPRQKPSRAANKELTVVDMSCIDDERVRDALLASMIDATNSFHMLRDGKPPLAGIGKAYNLVSLAVHPVPESVDM